MKTETAFAIAQINEPALTYGSLIRFPEYQAEAIIRHYAAHASMALQTMKIMEQARYTEDKSVVNELIAYNIEIIKLNHVADFGIPLEWNRTA